MAVTFKRKKLYIYKWRHIFLLAYKYRYIFEIQAHSISTHYTVEGPQVI